MRKGWELKKLRDVCQIRPPKKEAKEALSDNEMVSFVPMELLETNKKYVSLRSDKNLSEVSSSYTYFKDGDVLLAKITPCFENGKLGIAKNLSNSIGFGSSEYVVYRTKEVLNNEFLYYFLKQDSFRKIGKAKMTGAVGHKRIPKDFYEEYHIPIPPLHEQKQIVAILDKAFAAIDQAKANIERNIENAKELFQSKLNEVFSQSGDGWVEKSLSDVASFDKTKFSDDNRPYVGLEHIESSSGKFIGSIEPAKVKSSTFQFDERHVLYGRLRPYLNKVLVPNFKGHCSTEIFPILPKDGLLREYLFFWLLTPNTVSKIDSTWTGARMPRANMNEVIKFKLPIPSIKDQRDTIKKLSELKTLTNNSIIEYNKKTINLEELKKSILQKAFAGELDYSSLERIEINTSSMAAEEGVEYK